MKVGPVVIPQIQVDPQTRKASVQEAGRFADYAVPVDAASPATKVMTERLEKVEEVVGLRNERYASAEEKRMAMHSQTAGVLEKVRDHLLATSGSRSPQENRARLADLDEQLRDCARQYEESRRLVNELRNPTAETTPARPAAAGPA